MKESSEVGDPLPVGGKEPETGIKGNIKARDVVEGLNSVRSGELIFQSSYVRFTGSRQISFDRELWFRKKVRFQDVLIRPSCTACRLRGLQLCGQVADSIS